jgi:hypothetical protein
MSVGKTLSIIGFSAIFMFVMVQILTFYGISSDKYGTYIGFYAFLLLSTLVLPHDYPTLGIAPVAHAEPIVET